MKEAREKMTLREHVQIALRAVKRTFAFEKRYAVSLLMQAVLKAVIPYVPVYFSAKVIDALCAGGARAAAQYAAAAVGLAFLLRLFQTFCAAEQEVSTGAIYRAEEWQYAEKAMSMAYESIEDHNVSLLRKRIEMESQTGYNCFYLYATLRRAAESVTSLIASAALSVSFFRMGAIPGAYKLALVGGVMLTTAVTVCFNSVHNRLEREYGERCVHENLRANKEDAYVNDYGAGMEIRLYGMEKFISESFKRTLQLNGTEQIRKTNKQALCSIPRVIAQKGLEFGAYAAMIAGALAGEVSVGSIARYVACLMMLIQAIGDLVTTAQLAIENHYYLRRYFSYFDIPNNMYQGSLTVEKRDDNEYDIEFRDVSFRYPNTDCYALRHINLKFRIGEKLAIVGMNGSGKTTFIKLLCRLYDPTEGEILLNGVNIRKYDYDEYMSIFSVVFQDFRLFSFQLGQVVASGDAFDPARAKECLEKANFGDRLRSLPDGLRTYLYKNYDEHGVEVSGGEAQKIALARALYKDAPFILLDEPTAALDPVSEYEVYSNFNAISGDKTAVYISHRLASCRFCDKIAVFNDGRVVQTGTHEQLLADENGKYAELWNAQAQYYV